MDMLSRYRPGRGRDLINETRPFIRTTLPESITKPHIPTHIHSLLGYNSLSFEHCLHALLLLCQNT